MLHISIDCPHCSTKSVAFIACGGYHIAREPTIRFLVLMQCQVCEEAVVACFTASSQQTFEAVLSGSLPPSQANFRWTYPEAVIDQTPKFTPESVERFYVQGLANVNTNFDAAAAMFRSALEAALKDLDPEGKGKLYERIDRLPEKIGITSAMKAWAHEIRDLGNEAVHDSKPFTREEASAMRSFTELFLVFCYTLPEKIRNRKAGKN